MQEVPINTVRIKEKSGKAIVVLLAVVLFMSPIVSITSFFCEKESVYILAEDFDEKEERNGITELEKSILISDLLKKSFIKTVLSAYEESVLSQVILCLEVLTPPPQFLSSSQS